MDLNANGYTVLIELTADAETHALLDYIHYYIHYLNTVFKEKELAATACFITNDTFGIKDLKSKEEAHDIVDMLKAFNVSIIKQFSIMHFSCNTEEVIENE
jgi:hypothetical protein